jgi:hypothetical protein
MNANRAIETSTTPPTVAPAITPADTGDEAGVEGVIKISGSREYTLTLGSRIGKGFELDFADSVVNKRVIRIIIVDCKVNDEGNVNVSAVCAESRWNGDCMVYLGCWGK